MLLISFANLVFPSIFYNIVFTGVIATFITHGILFVAFRLLQYDYIFVEETGSLFVDDSEFTAGLASHIFVGILITAIYALPYLLGIAIITNNEFGVYKWNPEKGTALIENMWYFLWLSIFTYFVWWLISFKGEKNEKQSYLLFLYSFVFCLIAGLIFGSYIFGFHLPGIIYN
ncbi:MAG: hypothetical protein ACW967_09995 [Candidatus Hodarchaeales archaeon]|jgi:hypothetical protein